MKIELSFNGETNKYHEKKSGVYRIDFDNNFFYIGGSTWLSNRFLAWKRFLRKEKFMRNDMVKMRAKIEECKSAVFSIIEFCNKETVSEREELWLTNFKNNPMMLNTFSFNKKPVLIFDTNGNFLEEWPSASWISKKKGIKIARVRDVLTGEKKSHKGLVYRYKFQEHNNFKPRRGTKKKVLKVFKYNQDGEFVEGFYTLIAAANSSNINRKGVYSCLRGNQKTAGGFIWKNHSPNG